MKKILLCVILLFSLNAANAQPFSASEMISYCNCKTFQCFHDYVITKGCTYDSYKTEERFTNYIFYTDKYDYYSEGGNGFKMYGMILFRLINASPLRNISYTTCNKGNYTNLLAQFKKLGFAEVGTLPDNAGLTIKYRSKAYPNSMMQIGVTKQSTNEGVAYVSYGIDFFTNYAWE